MVSVFIEKEEKTVTVDFEGKAKDLLKELNVNIHEVVIARGDELLTEEEEVKKKDNIRLLSVVSGG